MADVVRDEDIIMTAVHTIPFVAIEVGARMRQLREETVVALMESIREVGLLHPILLTRDGQKFHLVAGLHRLEAVKRLKIYARIDALIIDKNSDQALLAEIDENLIRAELTPAETALHTVRRKELYEKLHPETKQGGAPGKAGGGKKTKTAKLATFAKDTAAKTGQSERKVRRDVQRGKKIKADVLADVVGTPLDQGAQLDALAKMPPGEQRKLADAAKAGENVNATVVKQNVEEAQSQDDRENARRYAEQLKAQRTAAEAQKPHVTEEKDEDESDLDADLDALESKDLLQVSACCIKHVTRVIGKCTSALPREEHPELLNYVKKAVDYLIKQEVEQPAEEAAT